MALYAALLHYPTGRYWSQDDEPDMDGYGEFARIALAAGVLRGGHALQPPTEGRTVSVDGKGGAVSVTDGAFAETKEAIGGVILLDVADLDEALRWAKQIPAAWRGRVEVRAVAATAPSTADATPTGRSS